MDAKLRAFNSTINTEYKQGQMLHDSLRDPSRFWLDQAEQNIIWKVTPKTAYSYIDESQKQHVKWFPDGILNVSYNALDRHLPEKANKPAIIYDSPVSLTKQVYTYQHLYDSVVAFTKVLAKNGISRGDTVIIYMPMIPQTIIAMLSCARLGAIHSVVFGGFSSAEIAKRIDDCHPKVLLSATCGIEAGGKIIKYKALVDDAIKLAKYKPTFKIFYQREQCYEPLDFSSGYRDWNLEVANAKHLNPVPVEYVESNHPLYILYTSGTTSTPKGVVRPSGPHIVTLVWTMKYFFGLNPNQTMFCTSDLGWVVGHTYVCYAPLLFGATSVLYEGKPVGTPDPGAFFRVIEETKANAFMTAPTAMMVLRREDNNRNYRKKYDLSSVKGYFFAGERCVPEIAKWWVNHTLNASMDLGAEHKFIGQAHSVDHWWQTESGSPITGICVGASDNSNEIPSVRFGSAGMPLVGVDLRILKPHENFDEESAVRTKMEEANVGTVGNVVIKLPLPPGFFGSLWNDSKRFNSSYFTRFPGFYDTGDVGYVDKDGYVYIMSRDDDIINVAAHRLSTSAIEEVVVKDKHIAEVCVVPKPDDIKGSVPMAFAVLNSTPNDTIKPNVSNLVRNQVGAIASLYPQNVLFVPRLPKTRSGKILRKMIRTMVAKAKESAPNFSSSSPIPAPPTIDDPAIIQEIWEVIKAHYSPTPAKL